MKIAITGGTGFIGSHLTRAYLDAGHQVIIIDNLAHGFHGSIDPRARFYQVDIRDEKFRTILKMERPDIVSHHAVQRPAIPGEQTLNDADIHVRGLLNVLEGCVDASVRRIIFASGGHHLYGNITREQLPLAENTPLCPQSAHAISKAAGEWYVRYYTQHYGLKHTILRYADVYGEVNHPTSNHPLNYFISTLHEKRRPVIHGTGQELRDYIFIDDVVQANLCILTRGENQTFHISTGQGYTLNQLYTLIAQQLGSKIEPIYLARSPLDASTMVLDNSLARQILGWWPIVEVEDGIRRLIVRYTHQHGQQPQPQLQKVRHPAKQEQYHEHQREPITDSVLLPSEASLSHV